MRTLPAIADSVSAVFRRARATTAEERAGHLFALRSAVSQLAAGQKIDDESTAALADALQFFGLGQSKLESLVGAQRLSDQYTAAIEGIDDKLATLDAERNKIGPRLDELHAEIVTLERRRKQIECEIADHCRAKARRDQHAGLWAVLFSDDADDAMAQIDAGLPGADVPRSQWEVR